MLDSAPKRQYAIIIPESPSQGIEILCRIMRSGIKIISETRGEGGEIKKGDRLSIRYDIHLSKGDVVSEDEEMTYTVGDRNVIAGFRYGLEGMRIGGIRRFKASPHLCYRDLEVEGIPKNAVLIFSIKEIRGIS
jgi:FKBP-type peptidyl-prolyl cis-trans isomerase